MKRLYVLTRNDLGIAYQSVQGAHAVAQFVLDYPNSDWKNNYLVFLAVNDMGELDEWLGKLNYQNKMKPKNKQLPISIFKEPDLNNQLTAIAVYTKGSKFKNLPIMDNV